MSSTSLTRIPRAPVVTVMGHIDHGKSTLLDYIRKTKVTETEAGGITQHLSAYEVEHTGESGPRTITFLDTPGHEAFQHLRSRGSNVADLAILVVAADDGVKPQTLQALKAINEAHIPYIVAISKIDKANADVERTKLSLVEHGVYLERYGGSISYVPISSKTGEGVQTLLDLLLLMADLAELSGDPTLPASGTVIESHCDPKRGISAVLLIKDGTLRTGSYVVAGAACAPTRLIENFRGAPVREASFSSPVMVTGFSTTPPVGSPFTVVGTKKEAQDLLRSYAPTVLNHCAPDGATGEGCFSLPVVLKSDVVGSIDAIKHELKKHEDERTAIRVVHEGVGTITEGDIKQAGGSADTIVIGFNVGVDAAATELAERLGITIARFAIIYELADWLPEAIRTRRPAVCGEVELGAGTVLKVFSTSHKLHTIGCRIASGVFSVKDRIVCRRGNEELGRGHVQSIKSGRSDVSHINAPADCGMQLHIELDTELAYGDSVVAFTVRTA